MPYKYTAGRLEADALVIGFVLFVPHPLPVFEKMDKVKNLLSPLASGTINDTLVSSQSPEPLRKVTEECQRNHFTSSRNSSSLAARWKPPAERPSLPGTVLWIVIPFLFSASSTTHAQQRIPQNSLLPDRALFPGGLSGKGFSEVAHGRPKSN